MKTEEILNTITVIAGSVIKNFRADINFDTDLASLPNWSSLNHAVILNKLEKHYGIEFDLDEMIGIRNIGDICRMVEKKIS